MDKKLITEIERIREIISGKNILLESPIPPKLSQEIFDFALRQGDEFLEFIRPLAQREAQRIGAATDDLIDIFTKQIDDFDLGYSTTRQFSDDAMKTILRNATTEEFVEFLLKSKIIPASIDDGTSIVLKKVAELGRRGTPVPEGFIDDTVNNYKDKIESIDWLGDEIKEGLVSRFRKQLNQARVPSSLAKVGSDLSPEAVMRYALPDSYDKLKVIPEFQAEFRKIESGLLDKTWGDAVRSASDKIDYLKDKENFGLLTKGLDETQKNWLSRNLEKLKNMLISYRKEKYMGSEIFMKGPDGKNVVNLPKTMGNISTTILASTGLIFTTFFFISWIANSLKKGMTSATAYALAELLKDLVTGADESFSETRKEYSLVTEEEAKEYLTTKMKLNLEDYTFEIDPKDRMKMTALYIGKGQGPDYLIYREDKVIKHKVYTEEDRNKSFLDIFK